MKQLMTGTQILRMRPEGSGTRLTVEITPPAIARIPVLGPRLAGRIGKAIRRMHEPMDAELKELLESRAAG